MERKWLQSSRAAAGWLGAGLLEGAAVGWNTGASTSAEIPRGTSSVVEARGRSACHIAPEASRPTRPPPAHACERTSRVTA